jgi:hypothetical protein
MSGVVKTSLFAPLLSFDLHTVASLILNSGLHHPVWQLQVTCAALNVHKINLV